MKKLGVVLAAGAIGTALLATGCGSNTATNARRATNNVRHTLDGTYYDYGYGANPDGTYYRANGYNGYGYNTTRYSVGNGMIANANDKEDKKTNETNNTKTSNMNNKDTTKTESTKK